MRNRNHGEARSQLAKGDLTLHQHHHWKKHFFFFTVFYGLQDAYFSTFGTSQTEKSYNPDQVFFPSANVEWIVCIPTGDN